MQNAFPEIQISREEGPKPSWHSSENASGRIEPVVRGLLLGEEYEWLQDEGME
jgi:hypothetical protein